MCRWRAALLCSDYMLEWFPTAERSKPETAPRLGWGEGRWKGPRVATRGPRAGRRAQGPTPKEGEPHKVDTSGRGLRVQRWAPINASAVRRGADRVGAGTRRAPHEGVRHAAGYNNARHTLEAVAGENNPRRDTDTRRRSSGRGAAREGGVAADRPGIAAARPRPRRPRAALAQGRRMLASSKPVTKRVRPASRGAVPHGRPRCGQAGWGAKASPKATAQLAAHSSRWASPERYTRQCQSPARAKRGRVPRR